MQYCRQTPEFCLTLSTAPRRVVQMADHEAHCCQCNAANCANTAQHVADRTDAPSSLLLRAYDMSIHLCVLGCLLASFPETGARQTFIALWSYTCHLVMLHTITLVAAVKNACS